MNKNTARKILDIMHESEEHFRFMADMIPDIVWTALPGGYEDFHNLKFREYTGMSSVQAEGTGWQKAVHPEDLDHAVSRWKEALAKGTSYEIQYRLRNHEGIYRWFLVRAIPWKDENGVIIKWFGTTTDIHNEKIMSDNLRQTKEELTNINQELSKVNEMFNHVMYITAHDLSSPVSNMKMLFNLYKDEKDLQKKEKLMVYLETSVNRMDLTINSLNELIKNDHEVANHKELFFEDILKNVVSDLSLVYPDISKHIISDFGECRSINYIQPYLSSIFKNLVSNAYKYQSKDRVLNIHIRTKRQNDFVKLTVSDNGIGFNLKTSQDIFKPFKRFSNTVEGKGIGLFLVSNMVEKNAGRLEVYSKEEEGTVFTLYLKEYGQ